MAKTEGKKPRRADKPKRSNARATKRPKQQLPPSGQLQPEMQAKQQELFLAAFRQLGIITSACEISGIGRSTVYRWRDDPEFEVKFKDAVEEAVDRLEAEARRRAVEGVEEPIIGRVDKDLDGVIVHVRKYSDRLMELLLRGNRRDKYNTKQHEITGKDGAPLSIDPSKLSDEQLQQVAQLLRSMAGSEEK
jgi:hypothetical protein